MFKVFYISEGGYLASAIVYHVVGLGLWYQPGEPTTGKVGPIAFFEQWRSAYDFLWHLAGIPALPPNHRFEIWRIEVEDMHVLDSDHLPHYGDLHHLPPPVQKEWWKSGDLPISCSTVLVPLGTRWAWTVTPIEKVYPPNKLNPPFAL